MYLVERFIRSVGEININQYQLAALAAKNYRIHIALL